MVFVLYLHIVFEGLVGLLLLAYPAATDLLPGFGKGEGASFDMLVKMYGLAALFLAAMGVFALRQRKLAPSIAFQLVLLLSTFHFLMAIIQYVYNPDTNAALLHFLLGIFLAGIYVRRGKLQAAGM